MKQATPQSCITPARESHLTRSASLTDMRGSGHITDLTLFIIVQRLLQAQAAKAQA